MSGTISRQRRKTKFYELFFARDSTDIGYSEYRVEVWVSIASKPRIIVWFSAPELSIAVYRDFPCFELGL